MHQLKFMYFVLAGVLVASPAPAIGGPGRDAVGGPVDRPSRVLDAPRPAAPAPPLEEVRSSGPESRPRPPVSYIPMFPRLPDPVTTPAADVRHRRSTGEVAPIGVIPADPEQLADGTISAADVMTRFERAGSSPPRVIVGEVTSPDPSQNATVFARGERGGDRRDPSVIRGSGNAITLDDPTADHAAVGRISPIAPGPDQQADAASTIPADRPTGPADAGTRGDRADGRITPPSATENAAMPSPPTS